MRVLEKRVLLALIGRSQSSTLEQKCSQAINAPTEHIVGSVAGGVVLAAADLDDE